MWFAGILVNFVCFLNIYLPFYGQNSDEFVEKTRHKHTNFWDANLHITPISPERPRKPITPPNLVSPPESTESEPHRTRSFRAPKNNRASRPGGPQQPHPTLSSGGRPRFPSATAQPRVRRAHEGASKRCTCSRRRGTTERAPRRSLTHPRSITNRVIANIPRCRRRATWTGPRNLNARTWCAGTPRGCCVDGGEKNGSWSWLWNFAADWNVAI